MMRTQILCKEVERGSRPKGLRVALSSRDSHDGGECFRLYFPEGRRRSNLGRRSFSHQDLTVPAASIEASRPASLTSS